MCSGRDFVRIASFISKNAHLTQIHVCTLFMFNYIQLQIVKNIHDMSNLRLIFIYKNLCFYINRP